MNEEQALQILCALILRHRNHKIIQAKYLTRFGRSIKDCSEDTFHAVGGRAALMAFWMNEMETNENVAKLALHLYNLHANPQKLRTKTSIVREKFGGYGLGERSGTEKFGLGDAVALIAHPIAAVLDAGASVLGVRTTIKNCGRCKRRRITLNKIRL